MGGLSPTLLMNNTGILILAAGGSSRLGRPKQLLLWKGKTLVSHVATEAVAAGLSPVVVVTGAFAGEVRAALAGGALSGLPVKIVDNPRWKEGMASSITTGLTYLLASQPGLTAVVIAVCDQPFVSAALFAALVERHVATGTSVVASAYAGSVGTPVLFAASQFPALLALAGDVGAKKIILQRDAALVDFPEGGLDIDTDAAYAELLARGSGQ